MDTVGLDLINRNTGGGHNAGLLVHQHVPDVHRQRHPVRRNRRVRQFCNPPPPISPILFPHFCLYEVVSPARVFFHTHTHTPKAVTYHEPTVMIGHITVGS